MNMRPGERWAGAQSEVNYSLPLCHVSVLNFSPRVFHAASPHASPPELCLCCDTICHFTLAKPHQQIEQRVALMQAAQNK